MSPLYVDIRQAITTCGKSRYQLSLETGISQGHLSEFMAGTKGLSVESLEMLADHLELEFITRAKKSSADSTKRPSKKEH